MSPLCPPQGPDQVSRLDPADPAGRAEPRPAFGRHDELSTPTGSSCSKRIAAWAASARCFGSAIAARPKASWNAAPAGRRSATFVTPRAGRTTSTTPSPSSGTTLQKHKWFSFGFNGQLANYAELRDKLLADDDHHLSRDTDTEIIMHEISRELSGDRRPSLVEVMRNVAQRFDGAYCLVLLNALGEMVIARDPLGIPPAVLRDRRSAVGGGERKRRALEPGLLAPEHPLARAGRI